MKTIIMSGPSSAGKGYWIKEQKFPQGLILSADHYFYGWRDDYEGIPTMSLDQTGEWTTDYPLGDYKFEQGFEHITQAHRNCRRAFRRAMIEDIHDVVIIDNTNTSAAEKAVYYDHASDYGDVEIVRLETSLEVCLERNHHDLPPSVIEDMWVRHHAKDEKGNLVHTMPWWNTVNG